MKKYIVMMALAIMIMVAAVVPGYAYRAPIEHLTYSAGNVHSVGACFAQKSSGLHCWASGSGFGFRF